MTDTSELVMMDRDRVHRSLKRMAYQIAEDNHSKLNVCLIGIGQHGFVTATLLSTYLSEIYNQKIPVVNLNSDENNLKKLFANISIEDTYPLVVDDVIFSGQTMFSAINEIYEQIRFKELHTAVLIDRGHRKFPVQAQFTGLDLSTKLKEHVSVVIQKNTIEKVVLEIN